MPHSSICYLRLGTSAKACSHHDVISKYVECVTNDPCNSKFWILLVFEIYEKEIRTVVRYCQVQL